jgi:hypothetical protein
MDCSKILIKHYKQYRWRCGETFESLVWLEDTIPKPTEEELDLKYDELLLDEMRDQRNRLLRESDSFALPDHPQRDKWLLYRQELRDFPTVWLPEIPFPEKPE